MIGILVPCETHAKQRVTWNAPPFPRKTYSQRLVVLPNDETYASLRSFHRRICEKKKLNSIARLLRISITAQVGVGNERQLSLSG